MPLSLNLKSHFHSPFHQHHKHSFHMSEPASLYLANTLRVIAVALVGIFLPIYIYTLSPDYLFFHSNEVINGISWVLSYFLLRSTFVWIGIVVFGNAIFSKLHFQLSMILSFVMLIVEILMWHFSQYNLFLILLAGGLAGLKVTFYWVPFHIFFLRKATKKSGQSGKKTSTRFFLTRIFSGLAPAVGGLVIVNYGFNTLFMVSILILVLAALPIALVVHDWEHRSHSAVRIIKNYMLNKKYSLMTVGYIGEGIDAIIYASFWPMLLYFVLDNFAKIGFINTLSFLLSAFAVLMIGRFIDKHGTKKIHKFGSFVNSMLYIPKMVASSAPIFYSVDILDRFFSSTVSIPMMSIAYEKARRLGGSDFLLFRELSLHLGIIVAVSIILISIQALVTWKWVFVIAIMGSLLTLLVEMDKN